MDLLFLELRMLKSNQNSFLFEGFVASLFGFSCEKNEISRTGEERDFMTLYYIENLLKLNKWIGEFQSRIFVNWKRKLLLKWNIESITKLDSRQQLLKTDCIFIRNDLQQINLIFRLCKGRISLCRLNRITSLYLEASQFSSNFNLSMNYVFPLQKDLSFHDRSTIILKSQQTIRSLNQILAELKLHIVMIYRSTRERKKYHLISTHIEWYSKNRKKITE